MKFELKDFQTTSARAILDELDEARVAASKGKLQAVVLSAPTGSGKTITVAAVIDWTFGGADGIAARPNTTFLWLSDSPELNQQSKGKLLAACDHVPFHRLVTVDSESFDEERLAPGHVYFINTQLLGKDKLLTKGGDKKTFTFWQTVANTIAAAPDDFVLIIDEAHRGAGVSEKARKPIMQKFITGSEADGLPAVPLVLGMSATPQRFTELLGSSQRHAAARAYLAGYGAAKRAAERPDHRHDEQSDDGRERPDASAKRGDAMETLPRAVGCLLHQGEGKRDRQTRARGAGAGRHRENADCDAAA